MNTHFNNRQIYFFLLGAIILLGAALRFYRVSIISLRADEAMTLFFAGDLQTIFRQVMTDDPHLPFYYAGLHYWLILGGTSELSERFPTIFAGVCIIPLTYILGRNLFPQQRVVAMVGAFLASINPYLIWDAQDAYIYAILTALTLASFIAMRHALARRSRWNWVVYIVGSALTLFTHYFAGLILIAQNLLAIFLTLTRRIELGGLERFWLAQAVIAAIFAPWLYLAFPVLTTYRSDFLPAASWLEMITRTLTAFTVGRADDRLMPPMIEPQIGLWLALGFAALFVGGLIAPEENSARWVLGFYLGVPLVAVMIVSVVRFPAYDERYVLYLAPAFLLLVARGIAMLFELPKSKWLSVVALVFAAAASTYSLYNYWYVPAFAKSPDWRGFVTAIAAEAQPGDALIQNYPDPALPYYLQNRLPRVLLPRSGSQSDVDLQADLVRIATKYQRVWFQPAPGATWDTDGRVADWLFDHAHRLRVYPIRGARLELYSMEPGQ